MDDSLSFKSFLVGARTAAQKAMDDHGRGEYDEFALHGGVAFERLAKAVLVSKNPAYLAEVRNGNSEMLLYLCGDLKEKPKNGVRTVGAMEAIGRLRSMGVLAKDEQLDTLIALRNGTAHTTVGDEAKTLLPALAANVEALMSHLHQPPSAIWGRWTSAIGAAVNKQRNEIQRDVDVRIKQARHLFEDRFKGLPNVAKEQVLKVRPSDVGFSPSVTLRDRRRRAASGRVRRINLPSVWRAGSAAAGACPRLSHGSRSDPRLARVPPVQPEAQQSGRDRRFGRRRREGPARAGMVPRGRSARSGRLSAPRACGDGLSPNRRVGT
ncbi:hypothetical protein [Streptomyces anulatus]|uniref:hypothetical protein n=1 Tax=Streptomyces anulatus TaxID=1892 RepID=UPI00167245E2|nr:hypothetical protein [Streptomyces anulatus]